MLSDKKESTMLKAFLLGAREFRYSCGMTYDNDPESPRSRAYDSGRELMHRFTLRRFDV
jgi:hypothetical protein